MKRRRLMGKLFAYIVYSITNVNKKYGNSSFVNPLSMSGDGTVTYTSNNTAVATIDNNGNVTIVAPGEAIITATVEDTLDFEYENNSASYTLIVAKADGNVSEPPTPKTIVYDGDDHQLINAGIGTGTMLYKFDYDEEWDEIIPIASEFGTYTILYKSSENQYYTESSIGTVDVTIQKALSQYIAPTPVSPLVYNTNAQNLLNEGSTNDGLIWYSTDEINWSTNVPQGTNAGDYRTYWELKGDYNHTDIPSTLIPVKMDKVTPTVTPPCEGVVIPYDGETHELIQCGSTDYGTLKYSLDGVTYSTSIPTASATDDYIIYWMVEGNSNVNNIEPDTVKTSISGIIVLNPTINLEYNLIDYDGTAKQPSVEVLDDDGNIISSSEYTVTYSDNVNVGTATVTITDVTGGTYIINGTKTFTINKIPCIYTAPTANNTTYNCSALNLLNYGSVTSGGTMLYSSDESNWSTTVPQGTNAGTYTSYWRIAPDSNHIGVDSTIQTTISKCTVVVVVPTPKALTFDNGSAQVLANPGSVTSPSCANGMEYSLDNSTWSSSVPSATNAGAYTVYYRVQGNSNINGVSGSIDCSISEYPIPTLTVELSQTTYTYDGTAKTPTVTVKNGSTVIPSNEYTVTYSNNVNAGEATVTISDNTGGNYTFVTKTVNFTINKADLSAPTATGASAAYGSTATAKASGGGGHDSIEWSNGNTLTGNAGSSKSTKARWNGNNNYNPSPWSNEVTLSIVKASGSITCATAKTGLTYNLSAQTLVNAASSSTGTVVYHSVLQEPDGTLWLHIAHHNNPAGGLFSSSDSFSSGVYKDANRWFNVHSAVSLLSTFEFLVRQKATTTSAEVKYRWRQNKSPLTATYEDVAPSAVTRITTSGYTDGGYGGLYILNSSSYMVIANTSKGNWFGAFGAWTAYDGGIPGYPNTTVTNGYTDLYVKVDSASINGGWSTVVPAEMDAATYTIACKALASTNYNESSVCTVNSTISRAKTSSASAANKTYNGTTETNGTAQPGVSGSYVSWSGTPSATNAGNYTAYANVLDSNYAWSDGTYAQRTINWTMSRRGQTAPTLNAASAAFHGTATASIKSYGTVANGTAQAPGSIVWENQSRTALGSQNARAYHAATTTNFSASGWSSTVEVKITCVNDLSVSVTRTNRTWNNSAQVLASAGSHGCTYYLGFGSSTTSAPSSWGGANSSISATNVGTYYIWKKGTKDGNHCNDVSSTYDGSVTISCNSNYTITAPTANTLTYNGAALNLLSGGSAKTTSGTAINGSFSYGSGTWVGSNLTGNWTFTPSNSGYCTKTGSVSGAKINARAITVTGNSANHTYDGSGKSVSGGSITSGSLGTGDTITITASGASGTNAGSYTNSITSVVIKKGSTDVTNQYSITKVNGSLSISKRPINVTAGSTSKTYDGSALTYNSATAEGTGTNRGLVSGHSMTSCTVTGTITNKGSVNNVPSSAVIKSGSTNVTSNYNINYVKGTLTINARAVTYRANDESWTYNGSTHSASNTATLTSGSLVSGHSATFSCSGSVGANVGSATKTLSSVTIKSGSTDVSGNYSITRNNGTLTINRAAGWTGFNGTGISITYSATTAQKTGTGASGGLSISSSNTSIATVSISQNTITATRKGYGSATITVTAEQAPNYNKATSTFTVSCNRASGLITCPTTKTLTYNGLSLLLVGAGSSSTGTVYYNVGSGSYSTSLPSASYPGTYAVHAYAAASTNYNLSSTCTITSYINKYTPTVTLSATNRAYNGSALYATATVSKPSSGKAIAGTIYYGTSSGATTYSVAYSGSAVNLSSVSVTNVGSVTVYAYFVPNSTCNDVYNESAKNASKTMTVSKASQNAPTATGATVVYNSTATASASGGGGFGGIEWSNGNTQSGIGSKKTKAKWKGDANHDASAWSNEVTLTVIPANGIDLGLPSGTLWADRNVGATAPEGIGTFFKYGNTAAFATSQSTYTGTENPLVLTKDAARNTWGTPWRIPTLTEVAELINNTNVSAVTVNGRNCVKFARKSNANVYIIVPCGGCKYADGTTKNDTKSSHCWTSTPYNSNTSYYFYAKYSGGYAIATYNELRERGLQIRPVLN